LESIGYQATLEGDEIRLRYQREDVPDPTLVRPLLEAVKSHKSEAVGFLRAKEEADRLFKAALNEVKRAWIPGLLGHIRRKHPDLWATIRDTEARLEEVWAMVRVGGPHLQEFQNVLTEWKTRYMEAINEHRPHTCEECAPDRWKACLGFWEERSR
jgi:hypothetical protein